MSDYDKMKQREAELAKKYPGSMSSLPEKTERTVGSGSQWKYDLDDPAEIARREAAMRAMQPMEDMGLPLTADQVYDMKLPLTAPDGKKTRDAAAKILLGGGSGKIQLAKR